MELIGIGDLHLTDPRGHSTYSRFAEYLDVSPDEVVVREVEKLLVYAVKAGVPDVVFYGDIGNASRLSYAAHLLLASLFDKYRKRLHFHIIAGNHDWEGAVEDGSSQEVDPSFLLTGQHSLQLLQLMKIPNVSIYTEPITVKLQGVKVQFLPYPHPIKDSAFDPTAINVFHNEVRGAARDNGMKVKGDHVLRVGKDVLGLAGHLHTNQKVRNIHYSGSPVQHSFGEQPEKFFHHVRVNITDKKRRKSGDFDIDRDDWEVVDVPIKQRYTLQTVVIETKKDWKKLPKDPNVMVRLQMSKNVVLQPDEYEKYVKDVKVVGFKPYSHTALEEEVSKIDESAVAMGDEVIVDTDDFLRAWFASQNMSEEEVDSMMKLRRKLRKKLTGSK